MIIKAFYRGGGFLEANIVKSCKGGTVDIFDCMIGYQEVLFPPHKYKVRSFQRLVIERVGIERFGVLAEGRKFTPVFLVDILVGVPLAS